MKIRELLRFEPFGERFEQTTRRFLAARFGGDWDVRWRSGHPMALPGAQQWLVNQEINAVFHPTAPAHVFDVVRREFSSSPVRWRRPLQRMYFAAAVSKMFASQMSHARVEISPAVPEANKWLIVPGTHKIRYIDTKERRVYCHLKQGSRFDRYAAEKSARRAASEAGVSVPRIVGDLSEECLVEEMILGTPLNRLTDARLRDRCIGLAKQSIQTLYDATVREERLAEYATRVAGEVTTVVNNSALTTSRRDTILEIVKRTEETLQNSGVIETVQCHGDFQPANILWDGARVWIIDWEYSTRRQRKYDELVYGLKSRFAQGIAARTRLYVRGIPAEERSGAIVQIRCFLLEELAFRCEELSAAVQGSIAPTFLELLSEAKAMLAVLSEEENAGESKVSVF